VQDRAGLWEGLSNGESQSASCQRTTVGKWRNRFVERRLEACTTSPSGCPASSVTTTSSTRGQDPDRQAQGRHPLVDARHAKATGMSQRPSVVSGGPSAQTWASDTFKLSETRFHRENRDVVGIYMNPPSTPSCLCRREDRHPGTRPDSADPADATRPGGAKDA